MSLLQARIKYATPLILAEWQSAADKRRFDDIPESVRPFYSSGDYRNARSTQEINYAYVTGYAQVIAKKRADLMPPEEPESTGIKVAKGTLKAVGLIAAIGFNAGTKKWWR